MTTGGWTLSVFCIFGKGHLQVLDLCGAAQEWIYCERRKTRQFLIRSVFGEEEKSHRSLEFAGSLRLFAETSTAADTGRIGEIWGKETGKHREEVRWRVEEEADRMWRGGMGRGERRQHCMKNVPPPPHHQKKTLRSAAHQRGDADDCDAYLPSISCDFTFRSASPRLHLRRGFRPTCKQHTLTKLSMLYRKPTSPRTPLLLPSASSSSSTSFSASVAGTSSFRQVRAGGLVLSSCSPESVLSSGCGCRGRRGPGVEL